MIDEVRKLMASLRGEKVVKVVVGPAGVHYDFGPEQKSPALIVRYGVLSNTSITIHSSQRQRLLGIAPFPPFSCQDALGKVLVGKTVTEADFDEKKNAARIILDGNLLLSLVPTAEDEGVYWSVYYWPSGPLGKIRDGFVITADSIERVKAEGVQS